LATGLDEDYRKPKNVADQVVRTLDEESIIFPDRLRLIALYLLYKDGLLPADLMKLLAHAQLPPQDGEMLNNLDFLGARVARPLKDPTPARPPIFARSKPTASNANEEEYSLSRFIPQLKSMLEQHIYGTLDSTVFPYTRPDYAAEAGAVAEQAASSASLRSAKPTWAKGRLGAVEPRQRIMVFMAGGATYSESRACYELSAATSRDIFLLTSHMITPGLFMRQVGDLSTDKRRLGIPADQPPKKAPQHLLEPEPTPAPPPMAQKPPQASGGLPSRPGGGGLPSNPRTAAPTAQMAGLNLSGSSRPQNGGVQAPSSSAGRLHKEEKKEKKKHHFFGSSKK
jgi:syntaxin-binding protein 1